MARTVQDDIVVVGAKPHPLRDVYHLVLTVPWWGVLLIIVSTFLVVNAIFAALYVVSGGIENAAPGSFRDAFYFSVQTMGTIGYGAMYPKSDFANVLVVAESVASLVLTALATGIVFARFSRTTDRLMFSKYACIAPMDGVPTLSFRIGNDRDGTIWQATVEVAVAKTVKTAEGVTMYRIYDLQLARNRAPGLSRSFNVMHTIDEKSPLYQGTAESFVKDEIEIIVTVVGVDGTSLQPVHGRARYLPDEILFGSRLADMMSERSDGKLQLDVTKFDEVVRGGP